MSTGTLFGLHMNTQQTCLHAKRTEISFSFHMNHPFPFSMQQGVLQTKTGLGVIPLKQLKTQL